MTDNESAGERGHAANPQIGSTRRSISPIWIVPLVAAAIALYLGWMTLSQKGPEITIYMRTAEGIEAGKTLIRYKAVVFGTVKSVELTPDRKLVVVKAGMTRQAEPLLRQQTQFWVVRPRLSASGGLTGLSTIVSGVYIEFDPGEGSASNSFVGLDVPPVVQADVPGTEFLLKADQIGSIGAGSPIFHRDVEVGQVMGFDSSNLAAGVTIRAFIRAPYDQQVHKDTNFWNASGIALNTGPQGFKLQLESLQAVLAGGVAFDTPALTGSNVPAKANTIFPLFKDKVSVEEAKYDVRLPYLVYFDGSVGGLAKGSTVEWRGLKIGQVDDIRLEYDIAKNALRAPVIITIEPERIEIVGSETKFEPSDLIGTLVKHGLRAQIKTSNFLTGQSVVALDIDPKAAKAELGMGDRYPVIPTTPNQIDSAIRSVNDILDRVSELPLDKLVQQANDTMKSFQDLAAAPEIKQSLLSLSGALQSAQELITQAKTDLGPAIQKLGPVLESAQQSMRRINKAAGSFDNGYGTASSFKRDLTRLMSQVDDAVRSIRVLSDYLSQHPESLLRGKAKGSN